MNSGYLRQDDDGHWYFLGEQNLAAFDIATSSTEKAVKVKINSQEYELPPEEILEKLDTYRLEYDPTYYRIILFDD